MTNIAEILQFGPSIDFLRTDRNRYDVGVRGFHQNLSDRVLVLINGRNANNPFTAEVDWLSLPVMVGDLEKVEIVRGPGGAAWGANAFSGVVNYMTVKPEDVKGLTLSTQWNTFGDSSSFMRYADVVGDIGFRISAGYQNGKSSEDAISNDNFTSSDWARDAKIDSELTVKLGDKSKVTMGAAHAELRRGPFEFLSFTPSQDERRDLTRLFAKWETEFADDVTGFVQVFSNINDENRPSLVRVSTYEIDVESQVNFKVGEHTITTGGNIRYTQSNPAAEPERFAFVWDKYTEWMGGLYAIDRWKLNDRLTIEPQARIDGYEGTQTDWSGRLSALYGLDSDGHNTLRISGARSFRSPYPGVRDATTGRTQIAPGVYAFNLLPPATPLENEQVAAFEVGLTNRLTEHLTLRTDAYYQWYSSLVGTETVSSTVPIQYRFTQSGEGQAPGAESELTYQFGPTKLSGWFSYNDFLKDAPDQTLRAFFPARFKAGISARAEIIDRWTGALNYRWQNTTIQSTASNGSVPAYNRLDMTLSRPLWDDRASIMFGVQDVFRTTNPPTNSPGSTLSHETPGRAFFVRLEVKF